MMKRLYILMLVAGILTFQGAALAQRVNLNFGMTTGVVDEFDQLLVGTATAPGDLVMILEGKQGIFPPDTNGVSDVNNPVLKISYIGKGTDPSVGSIGKASGPVSTLADRSSPSNTNTIFARIFNAPTLEEASFYTDSQLYDVPVAGDTYGVFYIEATKTDTPLDTSDNDHDGLSRSWEISYGTNPDNPDSDNDGMLDGNEILAGTDPNDGSSLLMMVELVPGTGGDMQVMWDSVAGKTYQLEYTTNSLVDEVAFAPINPSVTAAGLSASTVVTNGTVPPNTVSFRVRLIVD